MWLNTFQDLLAESDDNLVAAAVARLPDRERYATASARAQRHFNVRLSGTDHELTAPEDWIIPTGGGYTFAPSISAIHDV